MKHSYKTRIEAVRDYLKGGTLKETASIYDIHPVTLSRWVKWYKKKKEEKKLYPEPWNRTPGEVEKKVAMMKENEPALTVREARKKLKKQGITLSTKTISKIWVRYNLSGRIAGAPFSPMGELTPETECAMEYVKGLLEESKDESTLKKAAEIINKMPSYPIDYSEIILEIPEKYLSLRRKLDLLEKRFMEISPEEYVRKIRSLRKKLEKKGLMYSAILAGISEVLALHWMRTPEAELRLHEILDERTRGIRDPVMKFNLYFLRATANAELLRMKEAKKYAKKCRKYLKNKPHVVFLQSYGDLMTFMIEYDEAVKYFKKAINMADGDEEKRTLYIKIGLSLVTGGRYEEGLKYLEKVNITPEEPQYTTYVASFAIASFGMGKFEKCSEYIQKTMDKSKKFNLRNYIYASSLLLASMSMALGRENEAKEKLTRYLPLMKKFNVKREASTMQYIVEEYDRKEKPPDCHLLYFIYLIKKSKYTGDIKYYKRAIRFAEDKGIKGYLHRIIVFFPEVVFNCIKEGESSELPKSVMKFPIFDSKKLVYHVKFLGDLTVHRDNEKMDVKLQPKEEAFLIHLALKAKEPGDKIVLDRIYENFWRNSKNPARNLSHLLMNIRKKLKIPSDMIKFSSRREIPVLENKRIHFVTDYDEYKKSISQAKALRRAGEWSFAKKEYKRSISYFRGKPFEKMYDDWSEDMRTRIIFNFEDEIISFIKELLNRNRKEEAENNFRKVKHIIPYTYEEIRAFD